MRSNVTITFNKRTMCLKDWAETIGINYSTLRTRLSRGWSIARALSNAQGAK